MKFISKLIDRIADSVRASHFYDEKQVWLRMGLNLDRSEYDLDRKAFLFREDPDVHVAIYAKEMDIPHEYETLGMFFKKHAQDRKLCDAAKDKMYERVNSMKEHRKDVKAIMTAAKKTVLDTHGVKK